MKRSAGSAARRLSASVFAPHRRDRQGDGELVRVQPASAPVHSSGMAGRSSAAAFVGGISAAVNLACWHNSQPGEDSLRRCRGDAVGLGKTHGLACRRRHRGGCSHRGATGCGANSGATAAAWASRGGNGVSAWCARCREADTPRLQPGGDGDHAGRVHRLRPQPGRHGHPDQAGHRQGRACDQGRQRRVGDRDRAGRADRLSAQPRRLWQRRYGHHDQAGRRPARA